MEDIEPKAIESKAIEPIALDGRGSMIGKDNSELARIARSLIAGGGAPKHLDSWQKVVVALSYVRQMGLPDYSIRQCANIHGTTSIFGDLPLALARRTKELTHFSEKWFDKDYNIISFENKNLDASVYGSVTFIQRLNDEKQSFSFTLDDARKAGLYPAMKWQKGQNGEKARQVESPDSPWSKWTNLMLRYRSRSIGLKSLFADAIAGVPIAEYDFDRLPSHEESIRDVSERVPVLAGANEVNEEFSDDQE